MRFLVACCTLWLPQLAWAACVDVPASGVPRPYRTSVAYHLAFQAGHDEAPTDGQGLQPGQSKVDTICFQTFDPTGIVTDATMLTVYTQQEALRQAAQLADQARESALVQERQTNDLCLAELGEITTRIDARIATAQAQLDATNTQAQVKAHLRDQFYPAVGSAFKAITRCLKARTDRGAGQ